MKSFLNKERKPLEDCSDECRTRWLVNELELRSKKPATMPRKELVSIRDKVS